MGHASEEFFVFIFRLSFSISFMCVRGLVDKMNKKRTFNIHKLFVNNAKVVLYADR